MAGSWGTRVRRGTRWLLEDQRAVRLVLLLILLVDVTLALIHVIVMVGWDAPDIWRIDMDASYGEAYQYAKYLWIVALLIVYARSQHDGPILAWVPVFLYFIVDDAALLHERAGFWFSGQSWAFGLGPVSAQNLGELVVSGMVGLVLLALLVIGYLRADRRSRWIYRVLVGLMVALLIFAVVVDVVHSFVVDIRVLDRSLGFLEDLGEMLVLSAIVVFCLRINVSGGEPGFAGDQPTEGATRRSVRSSL